MPNVYEIVTEQVIAQLEQGVAPWRKPWSSEMPCNLLSQKPYRGLNVFFLATQGYESKYWLTFNQCAKLGGRIKAGSKSTFVTFWNVGQEKLNPKTNRLSKPFLLRYYRVFSLCQTEGIDLPRAVFERNKRSAFEAIETAETLAESMPNPPSFEVSDHAWYSPIQDAIGIPSRGLFANPAEYYSTLFHELAHSTGHQKRLHRENFDKPSHFGSESYSKEELVAEMTSAFLCGLSGIERETVPNSAAYLKTWIERLKSDAKLLITAASAAAQLAFLSKLDGTAFPPQTVFVFTCNTTEGLADRFLSRCMTLEFQSHGMAKEAADLLSKIWEREAGQNAEQPNFLRMVQNSKNNVRDAVNSLQVELLAL
jgi:antirestriction protein ArdC